VSSDTAMAGTAPPPPRLCHIRKVADFDGYGFNLHAEKNKPGQFVGKIDSGSPAEAAGLREGDRIVEVNGANVNQENHKQVVTRIKSIENETRLLVVDRLCEEHHRQHGVVVTSSLAYTELCSNIEQDTETIDTRLQKVTIEDVEDEEPDVSPAPLTNGDKVGRDNSFSSSKFSDKTSIKEENVDVVSAEDVTIEKLNEDIEIETENSIESESQSSVEIEPSDLVKSQDEESSRSSMSVSPVSAMSGLSSKSSSPSPLSEDKYLGLDLPCTAAEMKQRINSKKKKDPRKDNRMDFNRKHQIIQSL